MSGWEKVGRAMSICVVMLILTLVQEGCGRGNVAESTPTADRNKVNVTSRLLRGKASCCCPIRLPHSWNKLRTFGLLTISGHTSRRST
jgi:hypothetical protein